jgi:hypothetical protein
MFEGFTIGPVEVLLTVILFAAGGIGTWLYRHERWFREIVFPVVQALIGKNPRGDDLVGRDGIMEETDDRLSHVEKRVVEVHDDVQDLSRTQKRHNRQTAAYLRMIAENVDGLDEDALDDEDPLFRGDGSGGPHGDETND